MTFTELRLPGVFLLQPELIPDERGFFARLWSRSEFAERGLKPDVQQCSMSYNRLRGTLRGMHYQVPPNAETKLVRCTRGAIYDVVLDLRPNSPTFLRWEAAELSAEDRRLLYIPEGCAHGFQTLADHTEVSYQISVPYAPESARGVRWDDPAVGIVWPLPPTVVSPRDRAFERLPR